MRAQDFLPQLREAADARDATQIVLGEIMALIDDGHIEVAPDVIMAKVSAAMGVPFMLKDLIEANAQSPELQKYIDTIDPTRIKFSRDILTVKNQSPESSGQTSSQDSKIVERMAARAQDRRSR